MKYKKKEEVYLSLFSFVLNGAICYSAIGSECIHLFRSLDGRGCQVQLQVKEKRKNLLFLLSYQG